MRRVVVRIPSPLRGLTDGASQVEVEAVTAREALAALERVHHGSTARVVGPSGELHPFVNLFVDQKKVGALGGLDAELREGAVIAIVPAVAGGAALPAERARLGLALRRWMCR